MVRDSAGARLLNGKGVGWLGDAQLASDVKHVGVGSLTSSSGPEGAVMHPRQGGDVAGAKRSTAGGRAIGMDRVAWATPGHRMTWLGTCPRVGHVGWHARHVL